jgi:hypothetical protein
MKITFPFEVAATGNPCEVEVVTAFDSKNGLPMPELRLPLEKWGIGPAAADKLYDVLMLHVLTEMVKASINVK